VNNQRLENAPILRKSKMGERNVGHVLQGECITLAKLVRPSTSSMQHVACNNRHTPTIASQDTSALLLFVPGL
jgi:hypothetical protein